MTAFSIFKSTVRVALVIVAAAAVASALPAQAATPVTQTQPGTMATAPTPVAPMLDGTIQLNLGISQPMLQQGQQLQNQMMQFGYDEDEIDDWCLTRKDIRRGLIMANFDEIDFVNSLKQHRYRIEALYMGDGWVYSMQIDRCSGAVSVLKPIYSASDLD